jgi:tetratricopeptide (TPR) repeat protein
MLIFNRKEHKENIRPSFVRINSERKEENLFVNFAHSFATFAVKTLRNDMKRIWLVILMLLVTSAMFAEDNASLIEKGNKAYTGKFYQEALDCYLKVVKSNNEAAALYYNIGNTYYKLNDYPSAILYLEKAKKLSPGDEDINFNLKVANNKITDKIEAIPDFFVLRWYKQAANIFPFNTWAIIGIILFVLFLGILSLYLFSRSLRLRKFAFWCSAVMLFCSIVCFVFAQSQYSSINNTTEAIIFSPSVTAKSSPDANSTDLFVMHDGTKVRVIDNVGEWSEIKLANGSVGWVNTSVFKVI